MMCPACGSEGEGNFCSTCGHPLANRTCGRCGAEIPQGARFCTACGTALGREGVGGVDRRPSNLVWWVAGVFLVALLFVLGYPVLNRQSGPPGGGQPPMPGSGGTGGSGLVDLTTLPQEEQATILFNRVMSSQSAGDTADVNFFLPKALVVHEQLAPSDPDGLYHFALLLEVNGDWEGALMKAREGLEQVPQYLLLLVVAAEASAALGDREEARELYARFLELYDEELERMRPGYEHHQAIFPVYREEAEAFLGVG